MPRLALKRAIAEAHPGLSPAEIPIERPRDPAHGDYATSVALTLAQRLGRDPMDVAGALAAGLRSRGLDAEAAAPGFVNVRVARAALVEGLEAARALAPDRAGPVEAGGDWTAFRRGVWAAALKSAGRSVDDMGATLPVGRVRVLPVPATPAQATAEVGEEAIRCLCLTRPRDRALELDLALARRESPENPLFALRHAHARMAGVLRLAPDAAPAAEDWPVLEQPAARALWLRVAETPDVLAEAAESGAPHRGVAQALAIAEDFRAFYVTERVIGQSLAVVRSRGALVAGARAAIAAVLTGVVGAEAPEWL